MSAISAFIKKTQEAAKKNPDNYTNVNGPGTPLVYTPKSTGFIGTAANVAKVPEGGFIGSLTNNGSGQSSGSSGSRSSGSSSGSKSSGSKSSGSSNSSGSSGSSSSAGRSDYYNTRGDTAKEYQQWLNSQGANLAVDGIWGKKTEAAYQANKDAFEKWQADKNQQGSGSSGSTGGSGSTTTAGISSGDLEALLGQYQVPTYTGKSDADLRAEAEALYATQYNADKQAAEQRNAAYQLAIQQQIDNLSRALEENKAATTRQYELNGNALQRMLTSRGMGRSSYAGDVAQNNMNGMTAALAKLMDDFTHSSGQLSAQGAMYAQQTADTLARLLADRAANVTNAYNQLKDKEYDRQTAAQNSYNQLVSNLQGMLSDRNLTQQQLAESIRQFNEQMAENKRQFNASR